MSVSPETLKAIADALATPVDQITPTKGSGFQFEPAERAAARAERLKIARVGKGLRLEEVEELTGVPKEAIGEAEAGTRDLSEDVLAELASAYDLEGHWENFDPAYVALPEGAGRYFLGIPDPSSKNSESEQFRIQRLVRYLMAKADERDIRPREVFLLKTTRFYIEGWMDLGFDFWDDLLEFWRRQGTKIHRFR